jgi:hypothetical protein
MYFTIYPMMTTSPTTWRAWDIHHPSLTFLVQPISLSLATIPFLLPSLLILFSYPLVLLLPILM